MPKSKFFTYLRKLATYFIYYTDTLLGRQTQIIILCYHSISNDNWYFSTGIESFKEQINLISSKYKLVPLSELLIELKGNKKPTNIAAITFDDGYEDIKNITDFLVLIKCFPTIFLISDGQNRDSTQTNSKKQLLVTGQIKELINKYQWELGSHSMTHKNINYLTNEQIRYEVEDSKIYLEQTYRTKVRYYAYPKGCWNQAVKNLVKLSGYDAAFTLDDGAIAKNNDLFTIPRFGVNNSYSPGELMAAISPTNLLIRKLLINKV